ncbi:P-loop NTPase fold protein [Vibrio breoganii]|uniref:P-loop NTPase fold protein n=1 Tax=Vibrio breoganii TaxID=553239 RepID=UPI000CCB155B|nr:P-loop NTPase fold protein [Vibrio breoganii]PML18340.1 hypothetical protein BCT84_04560 [Vibrio breoganii]
MSEINRNVFNALESYCSLAVEPEYAVLLKGSWGCGKTHFIEEFIKQHSELKFLFVSLYGVSSIDSIEDKFFQQLNPILSNKKMLLAGKIGKGLLKGTLKIDLDGDDKADASAKIGVPDINLADYLTDTSNCVLVFDDLERCSMELNQILGYINYFVEKDGYKAIVIADEEKLIEQECGDKKPYSNIKEKLIGKTLHLESDVDTVLDIFVQRIISDTELRQVITENKSLFVEAYEQSGYDNLRSLRKVFIEFNSFYCLLDDSVRNNQPLIVHLLQLYTALSMEIYSGSVRPENFPTIMQTDFLFSLPDDAIDSVMKEYQKINGKYSFELQESLIDVKDWQTWFKMGVIDTKRVNETLKQSRYFEKTSAPEWKKLLHVFDLEQGEFDSLKMSVWQQFEKHEIVDFGGVKHVVGMYLYLAQNELIDKSEADVLVEAKGIVTSAIGGDKLVIADDLRPDDDCGSSDGFVYFNSESREFQEFSNFFSEKIYKYQEQKRISQAPNLMELIQTDLQKFHELLCATDLPESYAYKPILHGIPTNEFIAVIEQLSNVDKKAVFKTLSNRYRNQRSQAMKLEIEWVKEVFAKIEDAHKDSKTLDSLVMMKVVEWTKKNMG